jgi:ribonucleoside-diphosphate reductase alpha chain
MYKDTKKLLSEAKFYESYSRFNDDTGHYESWDQSVDRVMNMHRTYYAKQITSNPQLNELINTATASYKKQHVLGAQRALQFGGEQLFKHQLRMYNCFDVDTRFLTREGIKSFANFNDGDQTLVKTHTGQWKRAIVRNHGVQMLNTITLKRKQTTRKVIATANHQWILAGGKRTNELHIGDRLESIKDTNFEEFKWETSTIEQKLMWCYGFVYGDGTVTSNGAAGKYSLVRLCGPKVRFESRFVEMGFNTSTNLSLDGDIFVYTGTYLKTLPSVSESIENLTAFVRGLLDADGEKSCSYWSNSGKSFSSIYQVNSITQDFIRNVFPLVGAWVVSERDWDNCSSVINGIEYQKTGTTFSLTSTYGTKGSAHWTVENIQRLEKRIVWCLEVEDDHSFILEGGILTGNCTSSYADRPEFFGEIFYILLCGAGAGFSVQRHHVEKLPNVIARSKQPKIHVVDDSIEGWATALDVLLSSFFEDHGKHPEYRGHRVYFDLSKVRQKGAKISGGFKAPGPDPLRLALDRIEHILQGKVLLAKRSKLKPIEVYDIVMHTADAVLAGGVRRSATICLFSPDDEEMINAKTGNWFTENPQRARSNNSALIVRSNPKHLLLFSSIFEKIKQFGEPGFVFAESTEHCYNPCVEVGMFPQLDGVSGFQGCNLTEINGGVCSDAETFYDACRAASILGTLQAGYTDFKFLSGVTRKIFEREALLGVSITGWTSNPQILFDEKVLENGAKIVLETNKLVAKMLGINPAARATCVKPSGNASVLLRTPSGIHPDHSPMYFRNIQLNKDTEVAQLIKKINPAMVEESVWSAANSDYVVSFPVIANEGSLFKSDLIGVKHLELVKKAQQHWVEGGTDVDLCVDPTVRHNVSNTIIVDDWEEVASYVYKNRKYFAGISFISEMGDKIYNQAPNTKVMTMDQIVNLYGVGSLFASGLIVDAQKTFDNLWAACDAVRGFGEDISEDNSVNNLKKDWIRRFEKFASNYFGDDNTQTEYCLKDVYLLHRWEKIQQSLEDNIDWVGQLKEKKFIDVDTTGAAACAGVTETGEAACFI